MVRATIAIIFVTGLVLFSSLADADCGSTKTVNFTPSSSAPTLFRIDNPKSLRVFLQRGSEYRVDISASSSGRLDELSAQFTQSGNVLTLTVDDSSVTITPSGPAKTSSASNTIALIQVTLSVLGLGLFIREQSPVFVLALVAAVLATPCLTLPACTDYQIVVTLPNSVRLTETAECAAGSAVTFVAPSFVKNVQLYQTGWFASPIVFDLDNDGNNEVIVVADEITVYDKNFAKLDQSTGFPGRVYSGHVVADLDGDGIVEIAAGSRHQLFVFEWKDKALKLKTGWPQAISSDTNFEIRGLAAADLNGDGDVELIATTTITTPDKTVWVFSPNGQIYQPVGGHSPAWPRYNLLTGEGNDADVNGAGQTGYGEYGLNVGIGNVDDDLFLEVITTYDNHRIQVFKHDGVAVNAAPFYTNRETTYSGNRLTWGQMFRFPNITVEEMQYNSHTGPWWDVMTTDWLQFTDQAPSVADLDGDGENEVIVAPSMERGPNYIRTGFALMCYMGAYGDGANSAKVHPNWQQPPKNQSTLMPTPMYPPAAPTIPVPVDLNADGKLEVLVSFNDGFLYAFGYDSTFKWKVDISHGLSLAYCSEPTVADLNQDGVPEIILATYGSPSVAASGKLMVISSSGAIMADIDLPSPNTGGNGVGGPSAPTVADVDGDGNLEILVLTFDHGLDVFTVSSSASNCVLWPAGRGGRFRTGYFN